MNKLSLESFYGGKQGVSPIVKARFKYITSAKRKDENGNIIYDQNNKPVYIDKAYGNMVNYRNIIPPDSEVMETMFASINYEDVWYGQLAIIDTTNKRNKNNGKLFRRVLGRTEAEAEKDGGTLHGEYIGRIVGPSEGFPNVKIHGSVDSVKDVVKKTFNGNNDYLYPIGENSIAEGATTIADLDRIYALKASQSNGQLIPGAERNSQGKFVSKENGIYYSWVNVRDNIDSESEDTYVYLGFTVPYTVFDFDFKSVDWNKEFSAEQINREEYASGEEPFFVNWAINIPRGVTGNHAGYLRRTTFGEFRNLTPQNTGKPILYDFSDIWSENNGNFNLPEYGSTKPFPTFNGLTSSSSIIVYTFFINKITEENKETIPATCYIGRIADIESIDLLETGHISVKYSDRQAPIIINRANPLKWVKEITYGIDVSTGHSKLNVVYNDDTKSRDMYIPYLETAQVKTVNDKYIISMNNVDIYGNTIASVLKEDNGNDFAFSMIESVKVNPITKELKYREKPVKASNDDGYHSFDTEVILNGIEQTYLGKNGHLYVRYGSSKKRYTGTSYTNSDSTYFPTLYWYVRESDNTVWYKGGDIPNFTTTEERNGVWWLDLGVIVKTERGVRVTSTIDTFRYDLYYKIINNDKTASFDWNTLADDPILTLSTIFNTEWIIDGGTANAFDANPYDKGHVLLYKYPDINDFMASRGYNPETQWREAYKAILKLPYFEDSIGNFVYCVNDNSDGYAYFYDRSKGRWTPAGAWTSGDSSMQVNIKDYTNGIPTDVPNNKPKLAEGFTFIYENTPNKNIELPSNLWIN